MKNLLSAFIILSSITIYGQSRKEYLLNNRFDLTTQSFRFPECTFKIAGFGAYHGSAKTEEAELRLIQSLTANNRISYYLPETDFSIAYFFNKFLKNGDTVLLKDLILHYGIRSPQERSVETYTKWKKLKKLNDKLSSGNRLEVVGIDLQVSYKYAGKHLLELLDTGKVRSSSLDQIREILTSDTTNYSISYNGHTKSLFKQFVKEFEDDEGKFLSATNDKEAVYHIVKNLKITFQSLRGVRERTIYENYLDLTKRYNFRTQPQFVRFGFFHLEKSREGKESIPSFFAMLIENGIYQKDEVLSIIGYLTKSRVLWNEKYDDKGGYVGFTTKGGYGIGDYWKEYFRGIKYLKQTKLSDLTLYRLNAANSPYNEKVPDLMEIKLFLKQSNGKQLKGTSTLDFLDYAVLISNSKASTPVQELN